MKTLLGLLSLLCFGGGLVTLLLVFAYRSEPLIYALLTAILFGLAIVFRGLRVRMV